MKKAILLSFLMALIGLGVYAQTDYDTIKVTYTLGNIGTSHQFRYDGDTSPCPGYMNVPVPNNAIVTTVDVQYNMTASSPQRKADQRSQLWCTSPGGKKESEVYKGSGWSAGTYTYARTGLDIAFGVKPVFGLGVDFQLHAGSNNYYAADTCSDLYNRVDDSTWTVTVYYLPPGSPEFPSNPTPNDGAQLVSLTPTLTWDFSSNTTSYDLYFGTDNPPTTKVVDNAAVSGTTGTFTPEDTLQESTTYYWKVVPKNSINENPGIVWSFKTKCATPTFPYTENFDEVTVPNLPDCWIASTNGEYNKIQTAQSSAYSHSYPNYVKFSAEQPGLPEMVLVLPKVDNINDMMLSLWGKNPTNWTTGDPYDFSFQIGTVTDPFDYSTFTAYDTWTPGGDYTYHEVYFNDYSGTDEYIAISADVPQYGYLYLDDVTLDLIPNCVKPLNLTLDSITATTATISWTDLITSPGKWEIEYDTVGAEFGDGTRVEVTSNPATITGLLDGTYYNVYARSICGEGDTSDWSLPLTILTECLPKDLPIMEDFGVQPPYPQKAEFPLCWTFISETSSSWGGIFLSSYDSHTGEGLVLSPEQDSTAKLVVVSPEINEDLTNVQVSFWAKRSNYSDKNALVVGTMTDPSDYTTFHPFDTLSLTDEFDQYTVYFVNYTGEDTYVAWKHDATLDPDNKTYLDDIEISEVPSCIVPVDVNIESVSQTSFVVSWKDLNGANKWEILVGDKDFVPGTDPANSYFYNDETPDEVESTTILGLEAGHVYDVYMRTLCSETDHSEWEGPYTVTTSKPMVDLPAVEDFENGFGIASNDINNTVDWVIDTTLYVSGTHSAHNAYTKSNDNSLILGSFDLSGKSSPMLSFYQIAKVDGGYDHGWVEISVDGGQTWQPLPVSTYYGQGKYGKVGYYKEGPVFDEDSYAEWGTGYQTPDNTWWKKEYFDLSDYKTFNNVSIRFRLTSNKWTNKKGWWIDDVRVENVDPAHVVVNPMSISENVVENTSNDVDLTLSNQGGLPAKYNVKVVYDETELLNENFDNGIPDTWTTEAQGTNDSTWRSAVAYQTYYSFNGTKFAMCSGAKDNTQLDLVTDGVLLTPVIDASQYKDKGLRLEFDQAFADYYTDGDTARVYVYDGTQWVMIYEHYGSNDGRLAYNSNGVHKAYDVSQYANENFRVKFRYTVGSGSKGYYFAIENVKLRASLQPLGWLTVNDSEKASGVVFPDNDGETSSVTVKLEAGSLPYGTYTANVVVESTDTVNTPVTVPVSMTVQGVPHVVTLVFKNEQGELLEGVTATLNNDTVQSGVDGAAIFDNVVAGDYDYCAKKSGYGKVTGTITVDSTDYTDTIVMQKAYNLSFWFTHEGVALDGVEVTVNGVTQIADEDGFAMFEDLLPGDYEYSASRENYQTVTGTVTIVNGNVNLMIDMAREPHTVTFACSYNGNPLEGVNVTMEGVTVTSDADGNAVFTDIMPGIYTYEATKDAFVPVNGTVEVDTADVAIALNMDMIRYSVSFYCVEDGNPVEGVKVFMNGVAVYSDVNGYALFEDLLPGTYVYSIEKSTYFLELGMVDVVDSDVDLTINMHPISYVLTFNVNDGANGVQNAVVTINGMSKETNENGVVEFDGIVPGDYDYSVSVNGEVVYEDKVVAPDLVTEEEYNENINIDVTLNIMGIGNNSLEEVAIYPVPAKDVVNIDNAKDASVKLVDLSGKTVISNDIKTNHSSINVSALPEGIYFIYLKSDTEVSTYKIVVRK